MYQRRAGRCGVRLETMAACLPGGDRVFPAKEVRRLTAYVTRNSEPLTSCCLAEPLAKSG
jgi:hypothetical protein